MSTKKTTQPFPKKPSHWLLKRLITLFLSGLFMLALLFFYLWITTPSYPTFNHYQESYQPSDLVFLDRQGEQLHRLRIDYQKRQGKWIALDDVSPALIHALLTTEDKRFYSHSGVDFLAILNAFKGQLTGSYARGASTLTMQLVGLMDKRIAPSGKRTLWQKMQQAVAALVLEFSWDKKQILEAYLNTAPFKGELVGISALAEGVFQKHPNGLDDRESAITVAMLRSPNAPQKQITNRACKILLNANAMHAQSECEQLADFIYVRFSQISLPPSNGIAPHLAYQLLKRAQISAAPLPSTIHTTLDAGVQRAALKSLRQHLTDLSDYNIEDGAVIVLDNKTGHILAWVGSSGAEFSQAPEVDAVTALRQPGSTLKPFLFAQAIGEKRLTAATLLHDSSLNLNVGGSLYVPQNYDRKYKGWVSVRTALASSLNIPTVRTIVMVGVSPFSNTLLSLGLPLKESGEYYGYSLALGSAEVSLITLTNAYRALFNSGLLSDLYWIPQTDENQSLSAVLGIQPHPSTIRADAAWIISSILSDRHARITTFGLDSELNTRYWSVVKTGTSKDMRDNWAIGYSSRYTVGVWVGNASGSPMWNVSGTTGATPVWKEVMNYLYEQDNIVGNSSLWQAPPPPDNVVAEEVTYTPPIEPLRTEWFIKGTEQSKIELLHAGSAQTDGYQTPYIVAPVSGTIIALDPDIPPENQKLQLLSNQAQVRWLLGEHQIGEGKKVNWLPLPGRHQLILTDLNGQELDRIQLEVRGASIATKTSSK